MPGTYAKIKTVVTGEVITASDRNAEHDNHITFQTPAGTDDQSADVTAMRATVDPYPGAAESLPTSLQGELERLRYLIAQITGKTFWYQDPDGALNNAVFLTGNQTIAGIKTFSTPIAKASLVSSTAYEDEANVFTADQRIHKSIPSLHLRPSADSELLGIIMRTAADAVSGHFLYRPNDSTFYFTDAAGAVKFGLNIATGAMTTGIVPLARIDGLTGSIVADVTSISVNNSGFISLTVTGAAFGDFVLVSHSSALSGDLTVTARVIGADTVGIYLHNTGSAAVDPVSMTYYVKVIKKDF